MKGTFNKHWKLIATMMLILILVSISIEMILKENNESKAIFAAENSDNDIIPKPLSYKIGDGNFIITKDTSIYVKGNTKEETEEISKIAEFIREKLKASTGFELNIIQGKEGKSGSIYLTTIGAEESQGNEGYEIVTTTKNVKIIAYKPEGISRGVQTLRQL